MSKSNKLKVEDYYNLSNWEEVPTEDLWEDGELNSTDVKEKLFWTIVQQGEWLVVRRK
jgi:hypothetical protein|tara:strand:+ start:429 stop:602 length:174 start_codon:yes stop_codon:yes gene_type:complete